MLRACRRILKPGGRTAFFTITLTPGLTGSRHRIGARLGPRAVTSRLPMDELMEAAGYVDLAIEDVSAHFLETARTWLETSHRMEAELEAALGDELERRRSDWRDLVRGVEEGLLQRLLVTASVPGD